MITGTAQTKSPPMMSKSHTLLPFPNREKVNALSCKALYDLKSEIEDYDVIGIDEG